MSLPNFPTDDALLRLWGKTNRDEKKKNKKAGKPEGPDKYHPLLFHLLDVAFCAGDLWDRLPAALQARIADAFGLSPERVRYAVMLLAGLHDLGKAAPPFQSQSPEFCVQVSRAGFAFRSDAANFNRPHGTVSAKEITRLLSETGGTLGWNAGTDVANVLAAITGGHHGTFPTQLEIGDVRPQTLGDDLEGSRWRAAREQLTQKLQELLPGYLVHEPLHTGAIMDCALVPLLAGVISVADWFGSSHHFAIATPLNAPLGAIAAALHGRPDQIAARYAIRSARQAQQALDKSGWCAPCAPPQSADFNLVFAYLNRQREITANAVQQAVAIQVRYATTPYLLIVESAMGSGKTEAGLYAMDCALANGLAHGSYTALPTQATSNAMHARVTDYFYQCREEERKEGNTRPRPRIAGDVSLLLVHANAGLDDDYQQTIVDMPVYDGTDTDGEEIGRVIAQRWFTQQKKQALLAPFGVGTIDQALLSVLQTRHWFVRLMGLSGKIICFDEVHAYDTYMSTIFERLLVWLAEMRCPVVLLSATLPAGKRLALADAYCKGAAAKLQAQEQELKARGEAVTYPRLTYVSQDRTLPIIVADEDVPKTVHLEFAPPDPCDVLDAIERNLPDGGCVAVICNTVDRAQEVYKTLRDSLKPQGWDVTLFHARTPFVWRQEREKATLESFGKDSGAKGTRLRGKQLIVATQVIEQSLDLDMDLILSDACPVDLLLQRMGRLHRHKRVRVTADLAHIADENHTSALPARFIVLTDGELAPPNPQSDQPAAPGTLVPNPDGPPPAFDNAGIYDRYVLLRSWLAIRHKPALLLPADIQMLVTEVYDRDTPTDAAELSAHWLDELAKQKQRMRANDENKEELAILSLVPEPMPARMLLRKLSRDLKDSDDPAQHPSIRAATRDPSSLSMQVLCIGTDLDGNLLAAATLADVENQPPKQLLSYGLTVSTKALFYALLAKAVPEAWQKMAHLRYHRPLEFVNGFNVEHALQLSREMGLVSKGELIDP